MKTSLKITLLATVLLLTACDDNDDHKNQINSSSDSSKYYQTKTPYQPMQALTQYSNTPQGFNPVFTEMVARHGSRGLSSMKYDLALYNLWMQAKSENALTTLGEQFGKDVEKMMQVNILLGDGVDGIREIGYGNESQLGIEEHRGIADRLLQRLPTLFNASTGQSILVQSSGVDRAVDSAKFFTHELTVKQPNLTSQIIPAPYSDLKTTWAPSIADQGMDRFLLYFHSLNAEQDLANIKTRTQKQVYNASLDYQAFETSDELAKKLSELSKNTQVNQVSKEVLQLIFKPEFIAKIGSKGYTFSNAGTFSATTKNGKVITIKGKGKNTIASPVDAAAYVYELYSIAGGLSKELGATDFTKYMPQDAAKFYAEYNDADDFYNKGPSYTSSNQVTSRVAYGLKQDFFNQVDQVIAHTQSHRAVLRFAHAEIIIPFATALDVHNMMNSLPYSQTYNYQNSTWRGEVISPMAANIQWDVYQNNQGITLVKMLYNEKEIGFKATCDYARYTSKSNFYDYQKLKACYAIQ